MRNRTTTAVASLASVALVAALLSAASVPVNAVSTPSPSGVPISVVIPGDASPSPSPSSSNGGGGGGGNEDDGENENENENENDGRNPDGSPIPPGQPKENAPKLKVDKDRLKAGSWIIATASGYKPGEKAQLVLYPGAVVIASFTVGADGKFSARFRIPEGTLTGAGVIEVTGWESGYVTNAKITIVGTAFASNWLTLWWVYVVLGVLFLGILSVSVAFRREIGGWFGRPAVPESTI
jgi:hypothetical protein